MHVNWVLTKHTIQLVYKRAITSINDEYYMWITKCRTILSTKQK